MTLITSVYALYGIELELKNAKLSTTASTACPTYATNFSLPTLNSATGCVALPFVGCRRPYTEICEPISPGEVAACA